MGLFERARAVGGAPQQRRGLLHRSRQLLGHLFTIPGSHQTATDRDLSSVPAVPSPSSDHIPVPAANLEPVTSPESAASAESAPERRLQEILSAVTRLRRGLEAPARLFTLLTEELGLTKAALLLYDPLRLVYAPWAAFGFDPTTLQRLRIPLGCSSSLNPLAAGETLLFTEEADLAQLRAFFSFREFSSLRQVLLVPFVHAGKWIGILLVTGRSDRAPSDPHFYGNISERAAELLYEARERHLETLAQDQRHLDAVRQELLARPSALPELVSRAAQTASLSQRAVLAIRLDMRGVAGAVLRAAPALDPFRLQEDIGAVVLALASSVGTAAQFGADHLLVLIHGMGAADPELFLRHLESVLRHYFPTLGELEGLGLNPEVRSWNGPPEHAGQILDSFE